MDHPILDPSDDLDFVSANKADAIINFHRWGIPFEVQLFVRQNIDRLINDQYDFFKKAYQNDKLKRQDKTFAPFKAFVSKCARKTEFLNLTDEQIREVIENAPHKRPIDIARNLYPEEGFDEEARGKLNKAAATIKELIDSFGLEYEGPKGDFNAPVITDCDYKIPESDDQVLNKLKKYRPDSGFVKTNLDAHQRKCVRFLKGVLCSTRFLKTINSMRDVLSRQMFEEELVKSIYDKPDLISEDVNGYIDLAQEYVLSANINDRLNVLENDFKRNSQGDDKTNSSFRLNISTELNGVSKQLQDSKARIASISKALNKTRSERLDKESANQFSLFKIINKVADEEFRKLLLRAQTAWREKLKEEIEVMAGREKETDGEVHGISINELLGFSHTPRE